LHAYFLPSRDTNRHPALAATATPRRDAATRRDAARDAGRGVANSFRTSHRREGRERGENGVEARRDARRLGDGANSRGARAAEGKRR